MKQKKKQSQWILFTIRAHNKNMKITLQSIIRTLILIPIFITLSALPAFGASPNSNNGQGQGQQNAPGQQKKS